MIHFFFSSRRRHTRCSRDWSSDVCSSDLIEQIGRHFSVVAVLCELPHPFQIAVIGIQRSEEHTSELQSRLHLVCRLLLEKKKKQHKHVSFLIPHVSRHTSVARQRMVRHTS